MQSATQEVKIPISMLGESEEVLDRFREMVCGGMAPMLATILASRKVPAADTDTAHYSGMKNLMETAGPSYTNKIHKEAARHGLKVSRDMHFNGSIADQRGGGDPAAWQRVGDGRAHFRKVLESRGETSQDLKAMNTDRAKEVFARKEARFNKRQEAIKSRQAAMSDKAAKG